MTSAKPRHSKGAEHGQGPPNEQGRSQRHKRGEVCLIRCERSLPKRLDPRREVRQEGPGRRRYVFRRRLGGVEAFSTAETSRRTGHSSHPNRPRKRSRKTVRGRFVHLISHPVRDVYSRIFPCRRSLKSTREDLPKPTSQKFVRKNVQNPSSVNLIIFVFSAFQPDTPPEGWRRPERDPSSGKRSAVSVR